MAQQDIYGKLRPPGPTPAADLCQCHETPVKLMSALGFNPVHCMDCNREVPPERLALAVPLIDAIASWRDIYDAIDRLWLDSGAYEEWARGQLSDLTSVVNQRGRLVQAALNDIQRCYYWFFQDQAAADFRPLTVCPLCKEPLRVYPHGIFLQRVCERDSIVVVGE